MLNLTKPALRISDGRALRQNRDHRLGDQILHCVMGATRVDLRQPTGRAQDVLPVERLERRDVLVMVEVGEQPVASRLTEMRVQAIITPR